nr:hypothetical protein [Tanacetum cinerariifolium]
MYRPSYEPLSLSPQPKQGYSSLNRINLDMDMENLFNTQEYYAGSAHSSSPVEDDSSVEEVAAPVKAKKDHYAWKQVEMPLVYSKQNPSSKKAKTSETTSAKRKVVSI